MRKIFKNQKGFSLLEVMLAVTIAISLGSLQLGQIKRNVELQQSNVIGEELKSQGEALNSYITLHYNQISDLSSVSGAGTISDPGPRTCVVATGMCTITSETLIRSGLLPNSFSGRNAYGSTYNYYIRVTGTAPYIQINGLVVTDEPYLIGGEPRFDLIGQALLVAGADAGTTRIDANRMDGLGGAWLENTYPLGELGLLGYRVGYGTSGFASYLRLDGTTRMTGDLHMGDGTINHNILGVDNIESTGTISASKFRTLADASDALILGSTQIGNNGSAIAIQNAGGLQVVNMSGTGGDLFAGDAVLGDITSSGDGVFNGNINAASLRTTSGGIESAGNITAGSNITTINGNISTVNGDIITTNGNISAGGGVVASSMLIGGTDSITPNSWIMANGGGWYMTDTTWIRARGDKSIYTPGTIRGGRVQSDGLLTAMQYIQINGTATAGTACTTLKQYSSDANGRLLQCSNISGGQVWTLAGGINDLTTVVSATCQNGSSCTATCPSGYKLTGGGFRLVFRPSVDASASPQESYPDSAGNRWVVRSVSGEGSQFNAQALCAN